MRDGDQAVLIMDAVHTDIPFLCDGVVRVRSRWEKAAEVNHVRHCRPRQPPRRHTVVPPVPVMAVDPHRGRGRCPIRVVLRWSLRRYTDGMDKKRSGNRHEKIPGNKWELRLF